MSWVLIIMLKVNSVAPVVEHVEFENEALCRAAAEDFRISVGGTLEVRNQIITLCARRKY